jgi:hypothetical protein
MFPVAAMISTINGEFSIGKWNGDDVTEITELLLTLVVRTGTIRCL